MALDLNGNILENDDITSTGVFKSKINTQGLVLYLDAANPDSYPGNGLTWYDLSGNENNYTFDAGISWNSNGYFDCSGGVFTGPASNAFGFESTCENYIETYIQVTSLVVNTFCAWWATSNKTGETDTRTMSTHLPWTSNNVYYDIAGCCDTDQRISGSLGDLTTQVNHIAFRTKKLGFPNREIFLNLISTVDSGTYTTETATFDLTSNAILASGWYGKLHLIRVYNRPLNPYEMAENFNVDKNRFGL
jgi:hypothetical protein